MEEVFSKRLGISVENKEISFRYNVTDDLRYYVLVLMKEQGIRLNKIRAIVCKTVKKAPDPNQFSENDFMESEIQSHIMNCPWFRIYDIIENFAKELPKDKILGFENEINDYFCENGIGWKMENGVLLARGDDAFEYAIDSLKDILSEKQQTTKSEIEMAIQCLSIREKPDVTGSIQHSMAALECLSRHITNSKLTLGKLLDKYPNTFPAPLNEIADKLYGFASNKGRHLLEGKEPTFEEAQLIVHLSAALCGYLGDKLKNCEEAERKIW